MGPSRSSPVKPSRSDLAAPGCKPQAPQSLGRVARRNELGRRVYLSRRSRYSADAFSSLRFVKLSALYLTHALLAYVLVLGAAADTENRLAGLLTVAASLALTVALDREPATRLRFVRVLHVLATAALLPLVMLTDFTTAKGPVGEILQFVDLNGPRAGLHANTLGVTGAVVGSASFAALSVSRARGRLLIVIAGALSTVCVVGSGSRAAAIGLFSSLLVIGAVHWRPRAIPLTIGVGPALAFGAVLLTAPFDPRTEARTEIWSAALQLALSAPIGGPGYGSFSYQEILRGTSQVGQTSAHSLLLQALVDFGPLGLAALTAAFGLSLSTAVRELMRPTATPRESRQLAIMSLAVIAAVLTIGVSESVVTETIPVRGEVLTLTMPILPLVGLSLSPFRPFTAARLRPR